MKRLVFSLTAAVALLGMSACSKSSSTVGSETEGNWVKKASLPGSARSYGVSFTINNIAYIGTGVGPNENTRDLADFWAFDPSQGNGAWTQKANMPIGRRYASAFSIGNVGYVGLGYNYANAVAGQTNLGLLHDFYSYNSTSNTWSQIADFPAGGRKQGIGFSLGSAGYVGTGRDSLGIIYADIYKYDPATAQWTLQSYIPGEKRYGAVAFTYNNKAYIVTGLNSSGYPSDFYSYDGATGWNTLSKIKNALTDESYDDDYSDIVRSDAAAFVIGEWAYLTTGQYSSLTSKTWAYHLTTDRWERRTPYKQYARAGAVGFAIGNYGYIATGAAAAGSSTGTYDNVSQFDPSSSYVENDDSN